MSIQELEAVLEEAKRALEFYSNPHNWERSINSFSNAPLPSVAMLDKGGIAREALKAIKEVEESHSPKST